MDERDTNAISRNVVSNGDTHKKKSFRSGGNIHKSCEFITFAFSHSEFKRRAVKNRAKREIINLYECDH